jgi:hypothetical protein
MTDKKETPLKKTRTRKSKASVETTEAIQPQVPVKRERLKELQEYRFDKKMLDFVAEEMKHWIDFCFSSHEERVRVAAIVVKASQEYEKNKINSSSIAEQSDAIIAMAKRLKM